MLIKIFEANPYPEREDLSQIAKSIGTNEGRIQRWFNKMRVKRKTARVVHKSEYRKSEYIGDELNLAV